MYILNKEKDHWSIKSFLEEKIIIFKQIQSIPSWMIHIKAPKTKEHQRMILNYKQIKIKYKYIYIYIYIYINKYIYIYIWNEKKNIEIVIAPAEKKNKIS